MKLIFIRHAEPYYEKDSLTEKGFREAELLAKRTRDWTVTQFYCSPLGRAQATAMPTLNDHHVTLTHRYPENPSDVIEYAPDPSKAIVYPWLREFAASVDPSMHPGNVPIPWDFTPEYLNANPLLFDPAHWQEAPIFLGRDVKMQYDWATTRLDELLSIYGYQLDGYAYSTNGSKKPTDSYMKYDGHTLDYMKDADTDEPVLVFFCHLGIMMVLLSHLLNTSPFALLHGLFVAPSSVTVLCAEERVPGHAYFRAQMIGDTYHLHTAKEPVSFYGSFDAPFQF